MATTFSLYITNDSACISSTCLLIKTKQKAVANMLLS